MHRTDFDSTELFLAWTETLPPSEMIYPRTFLQRIKYYLWRLYTPYHPIVRDAAIRFGIVWHSGRQDYLLGRVAPQYSLKDFVQFVVAKGYGNHFVAWKDDGELLSLRFVENFEYQYHLRLYEDGEVRGHYEFTPECYPIRHMQEDVLQHRPDYFYDLLADRIIPHLSQ